MRRRCVMLAVVAVLLLAVTVQAHADGGCVGHTRTPGTVVRVGYVFNGMYGITVRVGDASGSALTTRLFVVGQRVYVTGYTCDGELSVNYVQKR